MSDEIPCPKCHEKNPAQNNYCRVCGALLKPSLVGESKICPFCQQLVLDTDYNCPNCGRKIREKSLSTKLLTQIGIYLLSFFLPPFGLWPGFKYLRQNDPKHKLVGITAILLTLISILISAVLIANVINQVNEQVNQQLQNMTF